MILCVNGCRVDEHTIKSAEQRPLKLTRHKQKFYDLEIPKELQAEIFTWLLENKSKWEPDPYVTFVPETILENEFIHLNIQEASIIVSIESTDEFWMQYSKKISPIHVKWIAEIEKLIESAH